MDARKRGSSHTRAVAAAKAIASSAAAEVAADAAATARTAVEVASAAAVKAAAKARIVAAQAVNHVAGGTDSESAAAAAASAAAAVSSVATAAAAAAIDAATLIREQLAKDLAAAATAVTASSPRRRAAFRGEGGPPPSPESEPALRKARTTGPTVADDLRVGIAGGQLRLYYQPIIAVATGQAVGVEALVRWQHPARGLLAARDFIEIAERDSLAVELGEWVLHEACAAAARLTDRGDGALTVAVNVSGQQLSDGKIVDMVRSALDLGGCDAARLVFELTETAPVSDMAVAVDCLRQLKSLGGSLALDDFGTGYSTLHYLKELPIDLLKIDQAFIASIGGRPNDTSLVASVISLAHGVNARCVAEGVETAAQLAMLDQLGCDFAQGYLFSRPMDEVTLTRWLDRQPKPHPPDALVPLKAGSPRMG
jgi:EAL domain-containing protein (putative c-di-GMP-specific phosphodiesterase class I)